MLISPKTSLVLNDGWRNLYYRTDYVGGPIELPHVDEPLSDPTTSVCVYGQPTPRIRSHTGYLGDPYLTHIVTGITDNIRKEQETKSCATSGANVQTSRVWIIHTPHWISMLLRRR
jgi:hypothetical protein